MPIGLMDEPQRNGRACEREARKRLGKKWPSVFASPCRPALEGCSHAEANRISKALGIGLSIQAFGLFEKLRAVDDEMRASSKLRSIVHEAHPELAFARMNGGEPVFLTKRKEPGRKKRHDLLVSHGLVPTVDRLPGAAHDDILDAIACCRTAMLIAEGKATRLGSEQERDRYGLPMNIWF